MVPVTIRGGQRTLDLVDVKLATRLQKYIVCFITILTLALTVYLNNYNIIANFGTKYLYIDI